MNRAMQCLVALAGLVASAASTAGSPTDAEALQRYGRHLARECTGCHRPGMPGGAIPSLAGRPADEIVALLEDYRAGRKTNAVMVSVARSLDEEQSAALAAYFAALPPEAGATPRR